MPSLADELLKLRFALALQSLYLNRDRVDKRFIGHLRAIQPRTTSVEW